VQEVAIKQRKEGVRGINTHVYTTDEKTPSRLTRNRSASRGIVQLVELILVHTIEHQ
jgi:NifB/MoaA-like Fe-S oxidoreductase